MLQGLGIQLDWTTDSSATTCWTIWERSVDTATCKGKQHFAPPSSYKSSFTNLIYNSNQYKNNNDFM